jgi:hypothetical protein
MILWTDVPKEVVWGAAESPAGKVEVRNLDNEESSGLHSPCRVVQKSDRIGYMLQDMKCHDEINWRRHCFIAKETFLYRWLHHVRDVRNRLRRLDAEAFPATFSESQEHSAR